MESLNWSTEWLTSLLWIARVFLFVVVGFALVAWLLIRRTRWGRQFWRLSGMYFIPRQRNWLSWPDSNGGAVAAADGHIRPARRRPFLPRKRLVDGNARAKRTRILEVHRHLRNLGDGQRRAGTYHLLRRPGTDHSLAALAQSADAG